MLLFRALGQRFARLFPSHLNRFFGKRRINANQRAGSILCVLRIPPGPPGLAGWAFIRETSIDSPGNDLLLSRCHSTGAQIVAEAVDESWPNRWRFSGQV